MAGASPAKGASGYGQSSISTSSPIAMADFSSAAVSIGFHGLAFAMVLYLISVGLSVTMGLMGFVNLAHGVFAMVGGYVVTSLMTRYGVPFALALTGAALVTAL